LNEELIAEAELGDAARNFVESELGRCVLSMAKQEIDAAHLDLEKTSPSNTEEITRLQNHIKVARWFEQWLAELIDKGNAALETWRQQQNE
jgi:hypothetical protein